MRIMILSNAPWTPSGYGQQTRIFTNRIKALGHEVAVVCYFGLEGAALNLGGIVHFPKRFHPYGNDIIIPHAVSWQADIILSNMDIWVMNVEEYPAYPRWVPWFPVDHDPMPPIVRVKAQQAFKRICVSKFGVKMTHEAGLDCYYIPYGIETNVFTPGDKKEARTKLGLPQDRWIVGTVAMNKGNPSRKNFVEMLQAFAAFHKVHPDSAYFLQTERGDAGNDMVNLPNLCRGLGLEEGKDVIFPNPYQNFIGYPPEYLVDLYRALDVHLLVSAGEGFGIPLLEAQACGCPVITSGWTANEELCLAGRTISKEDAFPFYSPLESFQWRPKIRAVELALHAEYKKPTATALAMEQIRAEYDADAITENKWKPTLAEIEGILK